MQSQKYVSVCVLSQGLCRGENGQDAVWVGANVALIMHHLAMKEQNSDMNVHIRMLA